MPWTLSWAHPSVMIDPNRTASLACSGMSMPRGAFRPCGVGRSVADDDSLDPSCGVFGKISVPSAAACLLRAVRFSEWCCGLHAATIWGGASLERSALSPHLSGCTLYDACCSCTSCRAFAILPFLFGPLLG